jgi:hypothetical protein
MNASFRPVLYLKDACPWCLKLRIFLLEAGLSGLVDERIFVPGDAAEEGIRVYLGAHLEKVTFPTLEVAPGQFVQDSQVLIDKFAAEHGTDVSSLRVLDQYVRGPLATIGALRTELAALKA